MPITRRTAQKPIYLMLHPKYVALINAKLQRDPVTGCLLWTGGGNRYPVYTTAHPRKTHSVHVLALEGKLRRKLRPGFQACHTCDTPMCCEPEHLYEGTQLQNMRDKHARGRHPTRYATRVLTDEQVQAIRAQRYQRSQYDLAREYNISRSVIQGIMERTKYKDVA